MRPVATKAFLLGSVFSLSGGALVADQAAAQSLAPGMYNWTGFYIGLNAGGYFGDDDGGDDTECGPFYNLIGEDGGEVDFDSADDLGCVFAEADGGPNLGESFPTFNLDDDYVAWTGGDGGGSRSGFLGGAQVGVNRQVGRLVFGVEGDFAVIGDGDGDDVTFDYFHSQDFECVLFCNFENFNYEGTGTVSGGDLEWISTLRARVGAALGPDGRFLLYGTGGLALAGVESVSGSFDGDSFDGKGSTADFCGKGCFFEDDDDDDVEVGFAVGFGGEYAITNNMSVGAEYLFAGFDDDGTVTFVGDDERQFDVKTNSNLDLHVFRMKFNYRFGAGGP